MSDHRTFIYFCLFIFLFNFFVQEIVSSFYISLLNLLSRGYDKVSDQMGEGVSLGFVFPFCPVFFLLLLILLPGRWQGVCPFSIARGTGSMFWKSRSCVIPIIILRSTNYVCKRAKENGPNGDGNNPRHITYLCTSAEWHSRIYKLSYSYDERERDCCDSNGEIFYFLIPSYLPPSLPFLFIPLFEINLCNIIDRKIRLYSLLPLFIYFSFSSRTSAIIITIRNEWNW